MEYQSSRLNKEPVVGAPWSARSSCVRKGGTPLLISTNWLTRSSVLHGKSQQKRSLEIERGESTCGRWAAHGADHPPRRRGGSSVGWLFCTSTIAAVAWDGEIIGASPMPQLADLGLAQFGKCIGSNVRVLWCRFWRRFVSQRLFSVASSGLGEQIQLHRRR